LAPSSDIFLTWNVLIEHASSLERPSMYILMVMDRGINKGHVTHIQRQLFNPISDPTR